MRDFIKILSVCALVFSSYVFALVLYWGYQYQDRLEQMYSFAGLDYSQADDSLKEYAGFSGGFAVSDIFLKERLFDAGYGKSCSVLEYLDLFGEGSGLVYRDSIACCDSGMSGLSPMVEDEKNDRYLFLCGYASDAHVVGVSKGVMDDLLHGLSSVSLDERDDAFN